MHRDLKSLVRKDVPVRLRPRAPLLISRLHNKTHNVTKTTTGRFRQKNAIIGSFFGTILARVYHRDLLVTLPIEHPNAVKPPVREE